MHPSRRRFLTAASAAAGASGLFSPAMQKAFAAPARQRTGTIQDVEHVVILMQENRAFDHYFGCLRGVRGYGDPRPLTLPSGRSVFHQPLAPGVAEAQTPFRLNSETTSAECMASLDHSWKGQHSLWRNHDAWIPVKGPLTMGYFQRDDIPFYYALADAFTICDAYHCSIFGPTNPNRLFLFSGTSGLSVGAAGQQVVANADDGNWTADPARDDKAFEAYGWKTYAERLQAAGVSWKLYQEYDNFGDNSLAFFAAFRGLAEGHPLRRGGRDWVEGSTPENAAHSRGEHLVAAFARDVAADALPQVSWIVAPTGACEHPDASPGYGEAFTAGLIEALAARPDVFAKTVFILNYDENDGFFDHVPPPTPALHPAQGASGLPVTGESFGGEPVGLGPRVPMLIVSPWTRGGWVDSQLFDHTSVLRFLEARFGVAETNISPWRRAVTGDLTSAFDFVQGDGALAALAALPSTAGVIAQVDAACKLAAPIPSRQAADLPRQEPGVRPARALPYALQAQLQLGGVAPLTLRIDNPGEAGAHLSLHARCAGLGPWAYTVAAGQSLSHSPDAVAPGQDLYDLTLLGPNGFLRGFRGAPSRAASAPHMDARDDAANLSIVLVLANRGPAPQVVAVRPGAYPPGPERRHVLQPGAAIEDRWRLDASNGWYDLTLMIEGDEVFQRRLAGHVETGRPSTSDPAFGGALRA